MNIGIGRKKFRRNTLGDFLSDPQSRKLGISGDGWLCLFSFSYLPNERFSLCCFLLPYAMILLWYHKMYFESSVINFCLSSNVWSLPITFQLSTYYFLYLPHVKCVSGGSRDQKCVSNNRDT